MMPLRPFNFLVRSSHPETWAGAKGDRQQGPPLLQDQLNVFRTTLVLLDNVRTSIFDGCININCFPTLYLFQEKGACFHCNFNFNIMGFGSCALPQRVTTSEKAVLVRTERIVAISSTLHGLRQNLLLKPLFKSKQFSR